MHNKWLTMATKWLDEHNYKYLLCRTGIAQEDDLLIFEMEQRTCFILVEFNTKENYSFGEVHQDTFSSDSIDLGMYMWGALSKVNIEQLITERKQEDIKELKEYGCLIKKEQLPLEYIKEYFFNPNNNQIIL